MYHRVTPPSKTIQAGMYVKPYTFNIHLKLLQKYFNVVPLGKLSILQKENNVNRTTKPLCVLTFDDGWKDFYDYAFPLLKKYKVSATVFLPTKFISSKKQFWTDRFAYLLSSRHATTLGTKFDPDILECVEFLNGLRGSFDNQLEIGIKYLKSLPLKTIEEVLRGLSEIWHVDIYGSGRDFLNWGEITEMVNSGLVSFGSHTVRHQILTTLNDEDIKKELIDSRKELLKRNVLDSSCISFCYPNGNHTKEIADMVCSSGYHLAVTTKNGWNHANADKFTLRRVGIHEDMTSSTPLFACRSAGLI